jgi:hypothetical protein
MRHVLLVVSIAIISVALTGCSTGGSSTQQQAAQTQPTIDLEKGLTKAEVREMYGGGADSGSKGSDGRETWKYHMNATSDQPG